MKIKINEVAKLTGITVRTLQYYDSIGLLTPSQTLENGYRLYDNENLETLQQILFFKELDFPLNEIKEIITNPNFNKIEALKNHKQLLIKKREHVDNLIKLITNTINGDDNMSFKEFDISDIEKYKSEVISRWGNTKEYKESENKTKNYNNNKWEEINSDTNNILKEFANCRHLSPDCETAQNLVKRWQSFVCKNFYDCSNEVLSCLGEMYIADNRFKENIDKNGEGTAEFMFKAIKAYCSK